MMSVDVDHPTKQYNKETEQLFQLEPEIFEVF